MPRPRRPRHDRDVTEQRPLNLPEGEPLRSVVIKSPTRHPFLFRKRIRNLEQGVGVGDLVQIRLEDGFVFGYGIANPRAELAVRFLAWQPEPPDSTFWEQQLRRAVELRHDVLRLPEQTSAYRVVHAEADGLSGLIVDRLGDVLSIEAHTPGMYQRAEGIIDILTPLLGTKHAIVRTGSLTKLQETFEADELVSEGCPTRFEINEFDTRFRIDFDSAHKTGFFCDQRENRRRLASFCEGRSVLDLCCHTGGFALQAKVLGKADDVTGVELDEGPLKLAKENANLNQTKINFVQADAFAYMRDMIRNERQFDVVVLDPPKLIRSRREFDEGKRTYFDFNRVALQMVKPGGLFLSCSCSGLMGREEFTRLLHSAARNAVPQNSPEFHPGRFLQVLDVNGAAADHPVVGTCPETEYLCAVWSRVS